MADQLNETSTTTSNHGDTWSSTTKIPADSDVPDNVPNGQETHSFADLLSTAFTATGPVPSPPADTESNMQLGQCTFTNFIFIFIFFYSNNFFDSENKICLKSC
jgi:hypothetical protein